MSWRFCLVVTADVPAPHVSLALNVSYLLSCLWAPKTAQTQVCGSFTASDGQMDRWTGTHLFSTSMSGWQCWHRQRAAGVTCFSSRLIMAFSIQSIDTRVSLVWYEHVQISLAQMLDTDTCPICTGMRQLQSCHRVFTGGRRTRPQSLQYHN